MNVDDSKFEAAYRGFVNHITQRDNRLFTTFAESNFLQEQELLYKHQVFADGQKALQREWWDHWLDTPGKILEAVHVACQEDVSRNLLEHGHRFGPASKDYLALEDLKGRPVAEMEAELYQFLRPDDHDPRSLAPRFDRFSDYLSSHSLRCTWRFLTYLVFLLDKEAYFPVLVDSFDKVMALHGFEHRLSRRWVIWENYQPLLDFAAELHWRLTERGHAPASLLDIHTYIFQIGYYVLPKLSEPTDDLPDWDSILISRTSKASGQVRYREEVGLKGERLVFEEEKARLRNAGRPDLADRVRHVAEESFGYDIASFQDNGQALYIEVKTTKGTTDSRFWLTNRERDVARSEPERWAVYRVVISKTGKHHTENIGNIVHDSRWHIEPDGYVVSRMEKQ